VEGLSVWKHLLVTAITVAGAMAIVWAEMPPDQRMMATLTAKARAYRLLSRAARRAGRVGMAHELARHQPTAATSYSLAYRLSIMRDRL
jgi:hypothetical protein